MSKSGIMVFYLLKSKKIDLAKIRQALNVINVAEKQTLTTREVFINAQGKDPYLCPNCGQDTMLDLGSSASRRGSSSLPVRTS